MIAKHSSEQSQKGEGVENIQAEHDWLIFLCSVQGGAAVHISMIDWFFCVHYKVGQLYMIAKHSSEQSQKGEGVENIQAEHDW
jgi:hypothetical protein